MPTKPTHCRLFENRTMSPFSSHRNTNNGSFRNPRWRGKWHAGPPTLKLCYRLLLMTSTGTCSGRVIWRQRITSVNSLIVTVSVACLVNVLTFSNQKPWVDRTIRDAVNHRTAAYNAGLLSGNMSEYKASCYALRWAVRAAKCRYRERIESHFQLNDSRRMWQGLKTICSSGNNSSAELRGRIRCWPKS